MIRRFTRAKRSGRKQPRRNKANCRTSELISPNDEEQVEAGSWEVFTEPDENVNGNGDSETQAVIIRLFVTDLSGHVQPPFIASKTSKLELSDASLRIRDMNTRFIREQYEGETDAVGLGRNLQSLTNRPLDRRSSNSLGSRKISNGLLSNRRSHQGWLFAALNIEHAASYMRIRDSLALEDIDEENDTLKPDLDHHGFHGKSEVGIGEFLPTTGDHAISNSEDADINLVVSDVAASSPTLSLQMFQQSFPTFRTLPAQFQTYLFSALATGTGDLPPLSALHLMQIMRANQDVSESSAGLFSISDHDLLAQPSMSMGASSGIFSTPTSISPPVIAVPYPYSSAAASLPTGPGSAVGELDVDSEIASIMSRTYTFDFNAIV
ncbi:hypothetical protein EV360DRAFT_90469 [Lentinula raphanica]|nr:hypothetical protein EV360DRAFT_90469 [Lentinula raphanica]